MDNTFRTWRLPQQQVIYHCNVVVMNMQMTSIGPLLLLLAATITHDVHLGGVWAGAHPLTNWFRLPDAKYK